MARKGGRQDSKSARRQRSAASPTFESSWPRRALVWLVAFKVVALVVVFQPFGLQSFDLPKVGWSRAGEWLTVAVLALALARYGTSIVPRTKLHVAVLAFLVVNGLATVLAENRYVALFGEYGRFLGLSFVADMAVLYLAIATAFRRAADWLVLLGAVGGASLVAIAYGFIQRAGFDPIVWADASQQRPFATFGNPDMFAHFLSACFGAAVGVALFAEGRRALVVRALAAVLALLTMAIVSVVATRGSAIGLGAVLIAVPIVYLRVRNFGRRAVVATLVGTLVGIAGLVGFVAASPLGARIRAAAQGVQLEDRLTIYRSGLEAFLDRPLLGFGPDNFGVAYVRHREPQSTDILSGVTLVTSAHSWLLQAATTTGVLGLASLLGLIVSFAWSAWRGLARAPAIAAPAFLACVGYFGNGLVSPNSVMVDWIPWLAFGAIASLHSRDPSEIHAARNVRLLAVPVMAVGIVGALSARNMLEANHSAWIAQSVRNQSDPSFALAAVRLDDGRARYWMLLGSAYEQRRQWRAATDAYSEAVSRAPHQAVYWANLSASRLHLAVEGEPRGTLDTAFAAARSAIAADPNNPVGHAALAQTASAAGQYDLAFRELDIAVRLDRRNGGYDLLAADTATRSNDAEAARKNLEELLTLKESVPLRVALARVALKLNDRQAALSNLRRALERDPVDADAKKLLAEIGD